MRRLRPGVVQRGEGGRALRGLRRRFERGGGGRRGAGRGVRRGVSFRDALPPGRWAAAGLFLRSLAARHGCGRVRVGNFLREYRKGRKDGSDEGDH
jgi:hypothetical protein